MPIGDSSMVSSARGRIPATSSKIIQLKEPRTSWWMNDRPSVLSSGSKSKKNSLLSGKRLSPSMYWVHDSHSISRRYICGVMCSDG